MEKRVVFRSAWLPYALVAPQIAITIVFFFWPAIQAGWYSFQLQDAFGERTQFVGLANFAALSRDPNYLHSIQVTALFSVLVAGSGITISLLLAAMADRVIRGALAYRTLLIWPYAVAPAVAGVLWLFLFAPSIGIITFALRTLGIDWDWVLQGNQAMLLVVIAATWKQISYNFLFFLAGLQSIPRSLIEAAAMGGASGPSSFRCSRPPPFSSWWSTSSTRSSTPSASSTPPRRAGPRAPRRSWSTRCTTTA
jgi:sn-glycerol 3-phosphate transport system permease protein